MPHPVLGPLVARATDPGLNPLQRLAADAALASASVRCAGGRVQMLLEARQALAVCLRCWQLQGWWPDPVGALLGHFPRFTEATEEFAQQQEEARKAVSAVCDTGMHMRAGIEASVARALCLSCPKFEQ